MLLLVAGCMSPERAVRETDEIGNRLVAAYRSQIMGGTNEFSLARPSDRLRLRLEAEGYLPHGSSDTTNTPPVQGPLVLSLDEALMAGARNSNEYQSKKESIFMAALALQLQQHAFENTFAGVMGVDLARKEGGEQTTQQASGSSKATLSRKLAGGATATASLGLDIVRLLTGERSSTLGIMGDATVKVPLLRGAGRLVAAEALTQAERNLIYGIYEFESYRQGYAISVASGYYKLLEVTQRMEALRENQARLSDNYKRAELLFEAGRMSQVELDQTRQDLLRTGDQLVEAEQARQSQLDSFKMTLGLPVDAAIEIDSRELNRLYHSMGLDPAMTNVVAGSMPPLPFSESEAIALALTNRHDLILARYRLEDAARGVKIAADALRPELTLSGGVSRRQSRRSGHKAGDETSYSLGTDLGLPWERSSERNAYRSALLAHESAARSLEMAEDTTKDAVRRSLRGIESSWSSFAIQTEALSVALRRVRSSGLFQQAGRASTRDVLEAQSALLSARNALVSAVINYRMAGLELYRDLSALEISEEGLWREPVN